MATLTPADTFDDVYSLDVTDPVKGGAISGAVDAPTDGHANAQAQALANRTLWLQNRIEPIGVVKAFVGSTAPSMYAVCNGAAVDRSAFSDLFAIIGTSFGNGDGSTTFNLPDLRGNFIRGWDIGAANDPDAGSRTASGTGGATGDNIGSAQDDEIKLHTHDIPYGGSGGVDYFQTDPASDGSQTWVSGGHGGNETRPKNVYLMYIIKAHN